MYVPMCGWWVSARTTKGRRGEAAVFRVCKESSMFGRSGERKGTPGVKQRV